MQMMFEYLFKLLPQELVGMGKKKNFLTRSCICIDMLSCNLKSQTLSNILSDERNKSFNYFSGPTLYFNKTPSEVRVLNQIHIRDTGIQDVCPTQKLCITNHFCKLNMPLTELF